MDELFSTYYAETWEEISGQGSLTHLHTIVKSVLWYAQAERGLVGTCDSPSVPM